MRTCAALPHARDLGNAFQLTNMIRDIGEDPGPRNLFFIFFEGLENTPSQIRTEYWVPAADHGSDAPYSETGIRAGRQPTLAAPRRGYRPQPPVHAGGHLQETRGRPRRRACLLREEGCVRPSPGLRLLLVVCAAGASSSAKESIANHFSVCAPQQNEKHKRFHPDSLFEHESGILAGYTHTLMTVRADALACQASCRLWRRCWPTQTSPALGLSTLPLFRTVLSCFCFCFGGRTRS